MRAPALFATNDFSDLDRGIPRLASLSHDVRNAYAGRATPVRYSAPLRLALRGTLDAMSSKCLNACSQFLRGLDGFEAPACVKTNH